MNWHSEPRNDDPRTTQLNETQLDELTRWGSVFLSVPESFAREVWGQVELETTLRRLADECAIRRSHVGTPRACFTVSDDERARVGAEAARSWDAATIASWQMQAVPHWQAAQQHASLIVYLVRTRQMDEATRLLRATWHQLYLPAGHSVFLEAVERITAMCTGPDALELLAIHRLLLGMLWPPSADPTVDLQLLAVTPDQQAELAAGPRLLLVSALVLALIGTGALAAATHLGESYLHHPAADWAHVPREWVPFFFTVLAEAYATAGLPAQACLYAARVEGLPHQSTFPTFRAAALRSVAHALNGEYERSRQYSARARAISQSEGWELTDSHLPLLLADLLVASARLDGAALDDAASVLGGAFPDNPTWTTTALVTEAMAHLCHNESRQGVAILRSVLNGTDDWGLLSMVRGFALGINADLLLTAAAAGETLLLLENERSPRGHALCFDVQRSSAYIELGQPAQVLMCTDPCIALGADHCLRTLPAVLIRRAVAYWQLDMSEVADRAFLDAFLLLRQSKSVAPFLNVPREVIDVLWSRLREQHEGYEADIRELLELSMALPVHSEVVVSGGGLTARELQLAGMLRRGSDSGQIARELFLSPNTVKAHLRNLYGKLGAHSKAAALVKIEELGLFSRDAPPGSGLPKEG